MLARALLASPTRRTIRLWAATCCAAGLVVSGPVSASLQAQAVVIDEGTFSLFVEGTRIGREDFSIRTTRGASGREIVAQANRLEGEQRRTLVLTTDSTGAPLRFRSEQREATEVVTNVVGEQQRGIWSGRTINATGETAREFRLARDTFVVEAGIIHHLWFLLQFGEGRSLTALALSDLSSVRVDIEEQAPDRVSLGLRELVARRWLVRDAASGAVSWELWTDPSGRLLRALHQALDLEALRDDPPPETRSSGRS